MTDANQDMELNTSKFASSGPDTYKMATLSPGTKGTVCSLIGIILCIVLVRTIIYRPYTKTIMAVRLVMFAVVGFIMLFVIGRM